jgi:hypothetical protein
MARHTDYLVLGSEGQATEYSNRRSIVSRSFSEIGLPNQAVTALAYHEPTGTLIAHIGPRKDSPTGKRLYFRRSNDSRYNEIGDLSEGVSISSFVLDPLQASLYFATYRWEKREDGGMNGNWHALYRFDLEEHRCEQLAQEAELQPSVGYQESWLCELISVSGDACSILCRAAFETPVLQFPRAGMRRVDYWVAKLNLANMKLEPLTQLDAVFA